MAAPKGTRPPNAGKGRKSGVPNRTTAEVRAAFRELVEGNTDRLQGWLDRVAKKNPAKALEIVMGMAEFIVPKLSRAEVTGRDGEKLIVEIRSFGGSQEGPTQS